MSHPRKYSSPNIEVTFETKRCIHSAECLRRLGQVFDVDKKPWVEPDKADASDVARTVEHCPSGALQYNRLDGELNEIPADVNSITVQVGGPLRIRGNVEIIDENGDVILRDTRLTLCRCGESRNKPFCDNTHRQARFVDRGSAGKDVVQAVTIERGTLKIFSKPNASYKISGPCEIRTTDGKIARVENVSLCRCGHSNVKPYCDGSHTAAGFES